MYKLRSLSEDFIDDRVVNMMRGMNFLLSLGIGKNQNALPEFVKLKIPILRYGISYQVEKDGPADETRSWKVAVLRMQNQWRHADGQRKK